MRTPWQYLELVRHLGVDWACFRAGYALRRRSGALKRATPAAAWPEVPAPGLKLAFRVVPAVIGEQALREADAVLLGRFRLFSHREVEAGLSPDWQRNFLSEDPQVSGPRSQVAKSHWSEISDFAGGDIKGVWELSRFPWAFALTRAHARTGEAKYAEAFWRLFARWCDCNPPNQGANWMCGQEATFRLMAVVFSAEGLGVPPAMKDLLARFIVATGRRIDANLDYALSQKNNHGVSECVGLVTCALLAPTHPESARWLARGLRELETQLAELVYADGGFSQHSLIYHRVLLHDLVWVKVRLERGGQSVPEWLLGCGRRATEFLQKLADPLTGRGPLYGPNDGANVLPLADADFLDLRPVLQLASALFHQELVFPAGPWDEATAWLVAGWERLPRRGATPGPATWHAPQAGCWQATSGRQRIFLRCPTGFRHRPAQADMLHVDVWQDGVPVAMDAGSFSYNSPERFTAFSQAAQHNAVTVDGIEPLKKFSRFLYLPWPKGAAAAGADGFQASYDGYAALGVRWVRTISERAGGGWIVHDRVSGAAGRTLRWHWRLADRPWGINGDAVVVADAAGRYRIGWQGNTAVKAALVRSDAGSAHGWCSSHYAAVEPACSLLIELQPEREADFQTEFIAND